MSGYRLTKDAQRHLTPCERADCPGRSLPKANEMWRFGWRPRPAGQDIEDRVIAIAEMIIPNTLLPW